MDGETAVTALIDTAPGTILAMTSLCYCARIAAEWSAWADVFDGS